MKLVVESDLWTDSGRPYPSGDAAVWWEVWLDHAALVEPSETVSRFANLAEPAGFRIDERFMTFPDRLVLLAFGPPTAWSAEPRLLLHVAELRAAKELATDYLSVEPSFAAELANDAAGRIAGPPPDAPAVCLLDTGVMREHPLLRPALAEEDMHTVNADWGTADGDAGRHGTTMAGSALYGSTLAELLAGEDEIPLHCRLESVKLYSPHVANEPDLYGNLTAEALARAEVTAPERNRAACLTVTTDATDGHLPSSWSARVDQLAAGGEGGGDGPRLIVVAAGNLRDQIGRPDFDYPMIEDSDCGIEDLGQSWNALTVGAVTDRVMIADPSFDGHTPFAQRPGDLSPTSRPSHAWPAEGWEGWPVKPDIVMEGGNWSRGPDGLLS